MWSRRELKTNAKNAIRLNYRRAVLVSLIMMLISNASSYYDSYANRNQSGNVNAASAMSEMTDMNGLGLFSGVLSNKTKSDEYFNGANTSVLESEANSETGETQSALESAEAVETVLPGLTYEEAMKMSAPELWDSYKEYARSVFEKVDWRSSLVLSAVWILFGMIVVNPILVGGCRFYTENAKAAKESFEAVGAVSWKNLAFSFNQKHYLHHVFVMFLMSLKIFLWTCLFYIPGIVKTLEYRMVPYLLAEYPQMNRKDAFRLSKELMMGEKWNAFVLDISFILWDFADYLLYGFLGITFLNPYKSATRAELYLKLKEQKGPELGLVY